ncbi:ATP-binding cassette domain-containing protein [Desulfovibrio sulfodismutans]|uniref:ATP-binding cassette domain-containing protein n=1 Tax=Desulfolutivibrio sulfodismutans TaxID=63561 RepID=A0A7K3NL51_9BACT|nr:ATP-binding cassette domain-containing protein [Desulfolutivibrio sulfodismutans]QLA14488.1 ATP-binding cassette domain-containing protein [Desulfolutivibrio sulfodismutans DSM 3696]
MRNLQLTRSTGPGYSLCIPSLDIAAGDRVAITGASGCGKSTALDLLGMVLRPDGADAFSFAPSGMAEEDLAACWRMDRRDRLARLRQRHMGYVLQTGGLLPFLTVFENIELPARALNLPGRRDHIHRLAREMGIERLLQARPEQLSIGERQRVAIGRALASRPDVLLADEPTASLDPEHARVVMDLLFEAAEHYAVTLILVTHSSDMVRSGGLTERRMQVSPRGDGSVVAVLEE